MSKTITSVQEIEDGKRLRVAADYLIELAGCHRVTVSLVNVEDNPAAKEADRLAVLALLADTEERRDRYSEGADHLRRLALNPDLPQSIAGTIPFSHHNKLWGTPVHRSRYVRSLLEQHLEQRILRTRRGHPIVTVFNNVVLRIAEIERLRLQLWEICEVLRADRKARWEARWASSPSAAS